MRIGQGIDVHAFGPGDHVMLGGVRIAHDRGLVAHSDGDVVIHALCDAMLGALALGDIGHHFPPSDPRWKDANSRHFLLHCAALIAEHGYALANADITVVCERPKIAPHVERCGAISRPIWVARSATSASRRRPARSSASPAAAKASPRSRSCCCGAARSASRSAGENPELDTLVRRLELDPL